MISVYVSLHNKDWIVTKDLFDKNYDNCICPCDFISFIHEINFIKKYKNKDNTKYIFLFDMLNGLTLLKKISCLKIIVKKIAELNKMYPIELIVNCNDICVLLAIQKFSKEYNIEKSCNYYLIEQTKGKVNEYRINKISPYEDGNDYFDIAYNILFSYPVGLYGLDEEMFNYE